MGRFKLICCQCGSDKVLEKSEIDKIDWINNRIVYGEGVKRKCPDCNNESFEVYKTWLK